MLSASLKTLTKCRYKVANHASTTNSNHIGSTIRSSPNTYKSSLKVSNKRPLFQFESYQIREYSKKGSGSKDQAPVPSQESSKAVDESDKKKSDVKATSLETSSTSKETDQASKNESIESAAQKKSDKAELPSKTKPKVKWSSKSNNSESHAEDAEKIDDNDQRAFSNSLVNLFQKVNKPTPSSALQVMTNEIYSMYSLPAMITMDLSDESSINALKDMATKQEFIALLYATPQVLTQVWPDGKQTKDQAYIGILCAISSIVKHRSMPRCEIGLLPVRRIYTPFHPDIPRHPATSVPIAELGYQPIDQADVDDIIMAAMPLVDNVFTSTLFLGFRRILKPIPLADLVLNRIAANLVTSVAKHDPNNVKGMLEAAFRSTGLFRKAELIHKAHALASLTTELSTVIDELSEMRRLKGIDIQMEKMLKHQLTPAGDEPEQKMLRAIAEMPKHLQAIAHKEHDYLKTLEPSSGDYGLTYAYLDWLVNLPWTKSTTDNFDMANAKKVLDAHHYGLEDIKTKILQLIANASRTGKISAKPLLFVGPPGSGKTTMAKAIAEALGRKFINISGLTESSDLRGFRRTYVGSAPGKVITEFRRVQSRNPVIVFDEVDKLDDRRSHKPITPVLLELLSPDQNKAFYDQYLDVPFDCSEALFICTANSTETISAPLLNRMHVIDVRAYSEQEKHEIMTKYVVPQVMQESGLKNITFEDESLKTLVNVYSKYEAGVRQLRRNLQRILRQIAVKAVKSDLKDPSTYEYKVTDTELRIMLGAPEDVSGDKIYENPPPGVVNGLAKNIYGGSTLTIEAVVDAQKAFNGRPRVDFTGNIMETMKESSTIAYTYSKAFLAKYFPDNKFFSNNSLHVHVPFASIKKDGPSAGCALVCSYISVALNKPLPSTLCMTGEITLTGRVTAVGGIREKVTAACQAGMTMVLIPKQNKADFDAIPKDLVSTITPRFVSTFEEAFEAAFGMSLDGLTKTTSKSTSSKSKQQKSNVTATKQTKVPGSKPEPKIQLPDLEDHKRKGKQPQTSLTPEV